MSTTRETATRIARDFARQGMVVASVDSLLKLADAIDKALSEERERAAKIAEVMRPSGGRMWTAEQHGSFEALTACAATIRNDSEGD